ncbi:MAG: proline dehydrogenase, partial [Phycisphaeraceae bacterium]|nr:proline dehydrogenase [Phycisphaeraceae bacterium]
MANFLQRIMIGMLPVTPGFLMWPVARRYIAGSGLVDAIRTTRDLNDLGATTTLDILGEELRTLDEARDVAGRYRDALDAIHAEDLRANISIKLSAFGVRLDPDVCRELVVEVLTRAKEYGTFVRFDMEDSSLTQQTLDLYRELRPEFPDTGVVLQAMLKRTVDDARALADEGARVRLVKGIYVEPTEVAHRDFQTIRETFVEILGILLAGKSHVGIATHDDPVIEAAERI